MEFLPYTKGGFTGAITELDCGEFIFQSDTVESQPKEAFEKLGMPADTSVGAYMDKRSRNGLSGEFRKMLTHNDLCFMVLTEVKTEESCPAAACCRRVKD